MPANSVAKPPCADTPKRRRMARRGHIRRYADTTVGGLGWLTPIRAYAGTPLADMPVRGKNTPIRPENTPIRRYADPGANTPIRRYADPGGKYADTPIWAGRMARCIGVSVYRCGAPPPPSPSLPPFPPPPPPPLPAPAGPHQASRPHLPCPGLRQRAGKQSPVKLNNLSGFAARRYAGPGEKYADTPGKYADTPIQEQIRRYADPGGKYADTPIRAGRMARCIGVSVLNQNSYHP